jgi:hypothetical protein
MDHMLYIAFAAPADDDEVRIEPVYGIASQFFGVGIDDAKSVGSEVAERAVPLLNGISGGGGKKDIKTRVVLY